MRIKRAESVAACPDIGIQLATQLNSWPVLTPEAIVSAYWPLHSEIDPRDFLKIFHERGGHIVLPTIGTQDTSLAFYSWQPEQVLIRSPWGFMEPEKTSLPVDPEILLLPLLAFDDAGHRLGYGQGHYDRTISALRSRQKIIIIGLAFDAQKVSFIPHDWYDQKLDYVVTPTKIYEF